MNKLSASRSKRHRVSRSFWITLSGIAALGLILILLIFLRHGQRATLAIPASNELFAGFKVMDLPRSEVPIGAVWTQGIGPVGVAPKNATSVARSLDNSQIESSDTFRASVIASLFRKIGWDSSGDLERERDLRLEHMTLAGITQASSLPFIAGNSYLWEAVRVDSFSVNSSTSERERVRAEIQKATAADNITENASGSNAVRVIASGTKLFVAYRVVQLELSPPQIIASMQVTEPTSSFNLGGEYRINFENRHQGDTLFSKGCTVVITVTSYRSLKSDGSPLKAAYSEPCGNHAHLSYSLANVSGSRLMTTDSLEVSQFQGWPSDRHLGNGTGTFSVERRTLTVTPVGAPSAPGW
jgi:hypothetical protein